jgi:hypothetical protein
MSGDELVVRKEITFFFKKIIIKNNYLSLQVMNVNKYDK